jgi:DNA-binding transcriptional MerR regulator
VPDSTYTISQLAAEFEVTPRAIRYYEDRGLLSPRRVGQNRVYSNRERGRLYLILRGRRVGFSLAEIQEMMDLYDLGDGQIGQMSRVLEKVKLRITALENQKRELVQIIDELRREGGKVEKFLNENSLKMDIRTPDLEETG